MSNLAVMLAARAEASDDPADRAAALDEAIRSGQGAVAALPRDHPDLAIRLHNLAATVLDRSRVGGPGSTEAQAAIDIYRRAAAVVTAPASVRMQAARSQGTVAARHAEWAGAVDGYKTAVGMLNALVTRAISRPSREVLLHQFAAVGSDAAACATGAGRPDAAVELLEQSRAVLWSQALDTGTARALRTAQAPAAIRLAEVAVELG